MTMEQTTDRQGLLESELARSESERARAEARVERLQSAALAKLRVETELRLDLERARVAQAYAQRSIQMALAEVHAMRDIWTHASAQLDLERRRGIALHAELDTTLTQLDNAHAELAALRVERDDAQRQLAVVATSSSWKVTRPIRLVSRILRSVRSRPS
jgi:hypothetical protein